MATKSTVRLVEFKMSESKKPMLKRHWQNCWTMGSPSQHSTKRMVT